MTVKERILATLRGEPTDMLPFVPRLDIWYNANSRAGTLPAPYQKATLREIVDDLGWGYHSIIPNFADFRSEEGDLDVGLGLYDLHKNPYRIVLHNVGRSCRRDPATGRLHVEYDTPKGKITTTVVYDDRMRAGGITLYVITEHAIKSMDDYPAVAYILNNAEVIPDREEFERYKRDFIGDRGVAVALSAMFASPGHYLIKELMDLETFYDEMSENPDEMDAFVEEIRPFWEKLHAAALATSAEVILSGANYDSSITSPGMFRHYITDELRHQSDELHAAGRFLATHTDGENIGILPEYVKAGIDIADSICPAPMTKITLAKTREVFQGSGITIWGGIPSIAVLKDLMSDEAFYRYVDSCMEAIGPGDHMIVSVADTVPPAASFDRLRHLSKVCSEFGPVPGRR
jgi:hypothetical protein